jgi:hypothetical protein
MIFTQHTIWKQCAGSRTRWHHTRRALTHRTGQEIQQEVEGLEHIHNQSRAGAGRETERQILHISRDRRSQEWGRRHWEVQNRPEYRDRTCHTMKEKGRPPRQWHLEGQWTASRPVQDIRRRRRENQVPVVRLRGLGLESQLRRQLHPS